MRTALSAAWVQAVLKTARALMRRGPSSRFRKLRESHHATVADYEKLLAPNVVFHSPVLIRSAEGRAAVAKIFATSTTLREGAYTGEWKLDNRRTLLRWKGTIQGHELESFDLYRRKRRGTDCRSHNSFSSNARSEAI